MCAPDIMRQNALSENLMELPSAVMELVNSMVTAERSSSDACQGL